MDTILGYLAFLLLHLAPLYAGYRLCRHGLPTAPLAAIATGAVTFWAGFLVLAFQGFGAFGVASLATLLPAAAAFGTAAHFITCVDMRRDLDRTWSFWRRTLRRTWPLFLVIGAVVFCVLTRGLLMPTLAWDSLTYHLVLAAHYVQTGGLEPFFAPDGMDGYSHFPENGEILAACFLLPFSSDTLLGLYGWPFLVMLGTSVFGTARMFRLPSSWSWLLALLVTMSPMCLAYLNSAYVDLPVAAEITAGVFFALRFREHHRGMDAILTAVAFGIATGTKPSAIPLAGLAGLIVLATEIVRWQRNSLRPRWLVLLACLVLGASLGAPKYVQNAQETGNPFYPIGLRVLGKQLPHSDYVQKVFDAQKEQNPAFFEDGILHDLLGNLVRIVQFTTNLGQIRTAGPAFGIGLLLALVFLGSLLRRGPPFWPRALLAAFFCVPLLLFYTDGSDSMKLVRRFWWPDCARFLTAPLALAAIAGLLALPRRKRFVRVGVRWVLAAFVLWGLVYARIDVEHRGKAMATAAAGVAVFLGLAFVLLRTRGARLVISSIALLVLGGVWTVGLQNARDELRYDYWKTGEDLHPMPKGTMPFAWTGLDEPDHPKTIAYTVGWGYFGHNWFMYPLMGKRLQNTVLYASVNRPGTYPTSLDRGLLRETGDLAIWRKNVDDLGVEYFFVQAAPEPAMELDWLQKDERFGEAYRGEGFWLFKRKK